MTVLESVVWWTTAVLVVYYLAYNVLYILLVARAGRAITSELAWPATLTRDLTFANPLSPGVSVLVPAHNEEVGILAAVTALLDLRYPTVEIVVVDDGSSDRTAQILTDAFEMTDIDLTTDDRVEQEGATFATLRSRSHPGLVLVRKASVGRRSDAINAALRVATQELVCMIDADSLLESDALLHVVQPFIDDDRVVAAGGIVLPSNGSRVHRGRIVSTRIPRSVVVRTQVLEYLRAFLVGRSGWSSMNGLLIISGAFGLFRREVVVELGGLDPTSLAEDADLVVGIHRMMRDRGEDFRVVFQPEPVCWTEAPATLDILAKQRKRWSQGLGELLWKYRKMIGNPRYRTLGVLTLPYFVLFEFIGPFIEVAGLAIVVTGFVSGALPWQMAAMYAGASVLLAALGSLAAVLVEEVSFSRYPRRRDVLSLVTTALLEPFWFHFLHSWWRAVGMVRALRGAESGWGVMTRAGHAEE
ncbi:glycosyltransferase family 2 protein [Sanguibacter massiliensis]|uniref:glycosyltransferase family 2 protein n=1 Tax=Sanguibacter massiliensis TaxID=1973217 RepID=UPI000C86530C|nr:glycosyltransferase [Sanguibacter massiliensis]